MLKCSGQIITVAKIKITVQINVCKHSQVSLFQWVCLLYCRFTHSNQNSVLDCVYDMFADYAAFCTFRDQNHVITFHKSNETQNSISADFLFRKMNIYSDFIAIVRFKVINPYLTLTESANQRSNTSSIIFTWIFVKIQLCASSPINVQTTKFRLSVIASDQQQALNSDKIQ